MSLKWNTAGLFFVASLVVLPVSVEFILRAESARLAPEATTQYFILTNGYWAVLLGLIALITLLGYIVGNRLGRKVDELIVGISKAGGGNYSQRISGTGHDELAQLVISYNRMLDNTLLATQETKEQLQSYKSIIGTAAEGIISCNDRGVIQEYNQSAEEMFGYTVEEIIGKNISKLIPPKVECKERGLIEQDFMALEGCGEKYCQVVGVRNNEQKFPIELSISASTINNAQLFTGIIRDISKQKERELKQQNLEVQLRVLQRKQTVESLTGGIAHDFNNILGPILGYADMALSAAEEGSCQHKYLTNIVDGAHRARELITRIMSFTRQYELPTEKLHLANLIEEALGFLKSSLPSEHQIEVFINSSDDLVEAERTQLTQVLITLVTNASQAMGHKPGQLIIRLDNVSSSDELLVKSGRLHHGEYVRMRVQDTGVGMDAVTKASIFEPFFSTRDNTQSKGLGLTVASGIISSFNGEILVETELNIGSTFSVLLPITKESEAVEHNERGRPFSRNGELILYVDDDPVIAEMGKEMLETLGYEVAISVNSNNALNVFRNDPEDYDLIITDQSMPMKTGTQLAKEIKEIREDIPIVLVTGFSSSVLNHELIDSGIDHCIAKPVIIDELGEVVLQALSKSKTIKNQ